ncbi:MAG: hypothetical protein ABFC96_10600 [Thermoguttaceae bacterium]
MKPLEGVHWSNLARRGVAVRKSALAARVEQFGTLDIFCIVAEQTPAEQGATAPTAEAAKSDAGVRSPAFRRNMTG